MLALETIINLVLEGPKEDKTGLLQEYYKPNDRVYMWNNTTVIPIIVDKNMADFQAMSTYVIARPDVPSQELVRWAL